MAKKKGKSKPTKQIKTTKTSSNIKIINEEEITAALSSVNQPVLLKMCRLCETKDGPFLNIFDPDKVTAKKIQDLMPFNILENDDLPHKICFRCSAKVEELHEFVQKCIRTQESLQATIGNNKNVLKTKIRTQWEEKLNKSNISNDDICNALIKKAMEGIKDIPLNPALSNETKSSNGQVSSLKIKVCPDPSTIAKKEETRINRSNEADTVFKKIKLSLQKCDTKPAVNRCVRSKNPDCGIEKNTTSKINVVEVNKDIENTEEKEISKTSATKLENAVPKVKVNDFKEEKPTQKEDVNKAKPFNIMDHVTTIKVKGVGILFQCKLCNRNFLKKEVVEVHACAKNGVIKQNIPKPLPLPDPPKTLNSVKYIDSKRCSEANKSVKLATNVNKVSSLDSNKCTEITIMPESKSKPKIGPASRIKRDNKESQLDAEKQAVLGSSKPNSETNTTNPSSTPVPIVNFPTIPSLNSRYKLVSGPNNTFTLVEDQTFAKNDMNDESHLNKTELKRKPDEDTVNKSMDKGSLPLVIDLDDDNEKQSSSKQQPYPVGLFSTRGHNSNIPPASQEVSKFTTPAMKKQSYTVVQTGDPSKLVISTKQAPVEDIPKKRSKKTKTDATPAGDGAVKEPFSVTLEDVAPPNKDSGFFTFINVDPLLQPSYVLPTDSIIQESQISTSTPAITNNSQSDEKVDKYQCTICDLTFSREKKMLTHIQSHYKKLDEEDDARSEMNQKKRKRKC